MFEDFESDFLDRVFAETISYPLVKVFHVRDEPFLAELIVPAEDGFGGIVGLFEDSGEGNVAPGVSVFNVTADDYELTDRFMPRSVSDVDGVVPLTPVL